MQFKAKGLLFFIIATVLGGLVGGIINGVLEVASPGGSIGTLITIATMIVPVSLTYILYENYIRKHAV